MFSALLLACSLSFAPDVNESRPNIVLIFADDQGYNDLGCFGSETIRTPCIDQMAEEGARFTHFYAQAVCGPSRAALMTGCYPIRVGEPGNRKNQHTVPHPEEVTVAEILQEAGYRTACIGKWHQGAKVPGGGWDPATMPNGQGFDEFFGTPLYNGFTVYVDDTNFRSPILRNEEVVVESVESWDDVTQMYTEEAVRFIRDNKDDPFFLYLAHNMPHVPVGASEAFKGKSEYGPYGDSIEEIDWSTGEILNTLDELGLDDNTLVIYTSDNGPWIEPTRGDDPSAAEFIPLDHSGNADPLRGYKMLTWEGGLRVPCVMRWPGVIPPGTECTEQAATIDLLPTFAALAGSEPPQDRTIDGRDLAPLLHDPENAASPREAFYYYCYVHMQAVRSGHWKLVLPRPDKTPWTGWSGRFYDNGVETVELYDMRTDPGEVVNVADANPQVVARLMELVEQGRETLGDYDRIGSDARFFDEGEHRPDMWGRPRPGASSAPNNSNASRGPAFTPTPYDEAEPIGSLRFTFEEGDAQGWKVVEGELGRLVSDWVSLPSWTGSPFNKQGEWHLSTLINASGDMAQDSAVGVVHSPLFVLSSDTASFLVGGGRDDNDTLYVALCDSDGTELLRASGAGGPILQRVVWDVSDYKGRVLYLKIVDARPSNWGHLTFDDFSAEGELARIVIE